MWIRRGGTAAAIIAGISALCATAPAQGQDTLSVAARLVMRQPAGVVLRLNVGNEQVTGVLDRVVAGSVYLASPERVLPLRSVTDAWLQRRSTSGGGKVGAAIGAPAGAAVFGFGAWLLSAFCEYECDDFGAGDVVVASLAGAALGAASGYLVGVVIGSSVPSWEPLTESSAPATVVAQDPSRHAGLSAFSVTPAVARGTSGNDDVGVGIGISYLSQWSRHFAIGGEAAKYDVTAAQRPDQVPCPVPPEASCSFVENDRVWSAGALARVGIGAERALEPYALVGLGVTDFGELTLGGYSAGVGLRFRPATTRVAISGEARWHSNFTHSGDDSPIGFYTLGLALSLLR